jgi:type I restriction enzyme S subunit
MIADLKPYPEYKKSGLEWLGKVPSHWDTRPAFGAFVPNHERNRGMKEKTVLSLSYGRIVIKPLEKLHGLVPESFETYQIVNPGDIVLRTVDLQNDHTSLRVGMVRNRGIITSAYLALRVNADVNPDFGFQFLNVWDASKAIYGYGSGLRQNLDFAHFKRMPVAVPPPSEQAAIVRFLDWANGRLERAIRAKRKVIALLNEQKQAIIHHAVTRGLDSSVPLKPSGIPWLGDIPQHWEVRRGKYLGRLFSTPSVLDNELTEDGTGNLMYLKVSDLVGVDDSFKLIRSRLYVRRPSERSEIRRPLLVFPKRGGAIYTNRVAIVESPCFLDPNLMGWEINARFDPHYVSLLLKTRTLADLADVSSVPQINNHHINPIPFPAPPVEEQQGIVVGLREGLIGVNTAIGRLEREVELLREYRTRLVADVVTGKHDVREAAARLQDEEIADAEPDVTELDETDDQLVEAS